MSGRADGLGRRTVQVFVLEECDSCALSRSCRRRDCLAESLSLVGRTCGLPVSISFIICQRKTRETTNSRMGSLCIPRCIHGHPNLLAPQLHRYAFQRTLCFPTPTMPSNAHSRLNQKLTSCGAVPEEMSLMSLVAARMALIQELTCG